LNELPTPPQGKSGWPWTEASPAAAETLPDGSPWPKISVVTPSYQQGQFLEETLRSVLLQGYSNLEYFVKTEVKAMPSIKVSQNQPASFGDG
jgi:cellulose synthase/poly-beta-1,6-N-acetylglucosamine synthase-like glycosyltransferase